MSINPHVVFMPCLVVVCLKDRFSENKIAAVMLILLAGLWHFPLCVSVKLTRLELIDT